MGKCTKMYNDWLDTLDLTLGTKELKFGLQAFEAGYKAASKLKESWDIHEPGPEHKKFALVKVSNDNEEIKYLVGYDIEIPSPFDGFRDIVQHSIVPGNFGNDHKFEVTSVEEMNSTDFEEIVGKYTAKNAYRVMEERDYFYSIVSRGSHSDLAKLIQAQDEADMDDEYYDFF